MESKSTTYKYSPVALNPCANARPERTRPRTTWAMAIPGLEEARRRWKEERGRTRKRVLLEKSTQVIRTLWMLCDASEETGMV